MSLWACCTVRSSNDFPDPLISFGCRPSTEKEDEVEFFDCEETSEELTVVNFAQGRAAGARGGPTLLEPEAEPSAGSSSSSSKSSSRSRDSLCSSDGEDAEARAVLQLARRAYGPLQASSTQDCPELLWADLAAAQRMLRATQGDQQQAVKMLLQALEIRRRDGILYQTLRYEALVDMRIIGNDHLQRPVIYFCAASQSDGLASIRDQIIVIFEGACRLSSEQSDGQVVLVVDMHGFQPRLNADFSSLKDLAETLGCVFAERIRRIVIVDFSRAATTVWWIIKPLLSHVTQNKFAFLGLKDAREFCATELAEVTADQVIHSFEVNRDPESSDADRKLHAANTTVSLPFLGQAGVTASDRSVHPVKKAGLVTGGLASFA
ncbi:unnamed protein product [Polarella glacialis]|uniref:CRAL-TRIO domain-containing protein n=2 Tax=Polarella glacialis TaxID=89957 RepID=A0A813GP30_POLGL|nr:unnamed protein product [Polarella glacialis]